MKTALVVLAAVLVAWISQWSFAPPATGARTPARSLTVGPAPRVDPLPQLEPDPPPVERARTEAAPAKGRPWTDADRAQLARTLAGQSNEQKAETLASLVREANAGKIQLDPPLL